MFLPTVILNTHEMLKLLNGNKFKKLDLSCSWSWAKATQAEYELFIGFANLLFMQNSSDAQHIQWIIQKEQTCSAYKIIQIVSWAIYVMDLT